MQQLSKNKPTFFKGFTTEERREFQKNRDELNEKARKVFEYIYSKYSMR